MAIILEARGPVTVAACDCCDRFCPADGGTIVHASHCDGGKRSERYYPAPVAPVASDRAYTEIGRSIPLNAVGNGAAEDAWHRVNSVNPRDWDRAMNRDD